MVAAALVLFALVVLLLPLLRRVPPTVDPHAARLHVFRDRRLELERERDAGMLATERFTLALQELEGELAQELRLPAAGPARERGGRYAAVGVALAVPVLAAALYAHLGNPAGLSAPKHAVAEAAPTSRAEFESMTARLAERLKGSPDDPRGWAMLGRAYKALGKFPESAAALAEANRRKADDPEILTDYAEALGVARGRKLSGEPRALLERALALDPTSEKALALLGGEAFERKDYRAATGYWERLLPKLTEDSDFKRALQAGIARARSLSGAKPGAEALSGEVRLDPALAAKVGPHDTLFVFARAAQGPRMPLAVLRGTAEQLPLRFQLDDSLAMDPSRPLSAFPKVVVEARVSRSGDAMPKAGDPRGASAPVPPGTKGLVITIDHLSQ